MTPKELAQYIAESLDNKYDEAAIPTFFRVSANGAHVLVNVRNSDEQEWDFIMHVEKDEDAS